MWRTSLVLLVTAILLPARASHASETVVFLAPRGPFFVGIELTVDKRDFRDWLTSYLFDRLDANKDGKLAEDELQGIPVRLTTRLGFQSGKLLAKSLLTEEKKEIPKDEFVKFIRGRLPASFLISEKEQPAVQAINIFPRFDADKDGHLSKAELENALTHQAQQDIDDDETLSAAELLPFRDPQAALGGIAPNPEDLPFIQVVPGAEDKLAERLARYYAAGTDDSKLTPKGLRLTKSQFAKFDADSSGGWDGKELTEFLKNPLHHVAMAVKFPRRGRAKIGFEVMTSDPAVTVAYEKREFLGEMKERTDRVVMTLDKLPVTVQTTKHRASDARFTRSFCGQRFSLADKDQIKYLDGTVVGQFQDELAGSVGMVSFEALDLNEDKMVTRDELFRHLDRDVVASQSQLEVTVASDGKSIFQALDENQDRRLSRRELMSGFGRIANLDQDADKRLSRLEASSPSQYTVEIGLGRAQLMRNANRSNMQMMDTTAAVIRSTDRLEGPLWFRKMDRNRDGDVSRREFLGTAEQFRKLDKDEDGLLDAKEAESAGGKADSKKSAD